MNKTKIKQLISYLKDVPEREYHQEFLYTARLASNNHLCGTRACIAGHTIVMERGRKFRFDDLVDRESAENFGAITSSDLDLDIYDEARRILGLTANQAGDLFRAHPHHYHSEPFISDAIRALRNLLENPRRDPWRDFSP